MKAAYLLLIPLIIFVGCRTIQPIPIQTVEKRINTVTIRETSHDTIIKIEADEATIKALIECDSAGLAILKQLHTYQAGVHIKPPIISISKDNVLTAKSIVDSFNIYMSWKETHEKEENNENMVVEKPIYTNIISGFQWFQIWLGRFTILALMVFGGIKFALPKFL